MKELKDKMIGYVEDDEATAVYYKEIFKDRIKRYSNSKDLYSDLDSGVKYDLFILDLGLPGEDGLSICQCLRKKYKLKNPIIAFTGFDIFAFKIQAIEAGFNTIISKDFSKQKIKKTIADLLKTEK